MRVNGRASHGRKVGDFEGTQHDSSPVSLDMAHGSVEQDELGRATNNYLQSDRRRCQLALRSCLFGPDALIVASFSAAAAA